LRLRWKIALGVVAVLAALLALNAIVVGAETESAEATIEAGEILELPGGEIQVLDEGPTGVPPGRAGSPIVLLHCYSCSLHWWDRIAPILAERHRVVRVDLLGHGGSEKPSSGYAIPDQAALVAAALHRRGIEAATVVGHSMGFSVAVALAEQASQLVDRMVNIGAGPDGDTCSLPLIARLAYAPVLGQALWRITPDFAIRDGYASTFAPDFDIESGFDDPDQIVADYRAMTFTSFSAAREGNGDFQRERSLDDRVRMSAVPLLSIFGDQDAICEPAASQAAYETVPGTRTVTVAGAGHSPNVERPARTARLIERFAAGADATASAPPP
jgi:pimeloyl-ACP methyl ester carboxylesterase